MRFFRKTRKTKRPVIERVNRANVLDQQPYLKCVKKHCTPKKTKKLRACSKDIDCENGLTSCIKSLLHEPIYKQQNPQIPTVITGSNANNGTYT